MKKLNIEATAKSPKIIFDPESNLFEMEGNSRPENVRDFFYPIIDTLKDYFNKLVDSDEFKKGSQQPFKFNFKLDYFNSASAKFISDILLIVKNNVEREVDIKVYWYFDDGDDDMKEVGEDFSDMISVPFNLVMIQR